MTGIGGERNAQHAVRLDVQQVPHQQSQQLQRVPELADWGASSDAMRWQPPGPAGTEVIGLSEWSLAWTIINWTATREFTAGYVIFDEIQ